MKRNGNETIFEMIMAEIVKIDKKQQYSHRKANES